MRLPCCITLIFSSGRLLAAESVSVPTDSTPVKLSDGCITALAHLRDQTNAKYGFRDGVPRVNLGPCGRFAKAFFEAWNSRFTPKVSIAFVMSKEGSQCNHVVVKLPDGRYFDGGNGTLSGSALTALWEGSYIEEMEAFSLSLLDRRSYGLQRSYPVCPNYSDEVTAKLIKEALDSLANPIDTLKAAKAP